MTGAAGVMAVGAVLAVMLAGCGRAGQTSRAPASSGAETYYRWLTGCLDAVEADLPRYTRSAETAAKLYVEENYEIGAWGGDPFVRELYGRAGGMMRMTNLDKPFGRNAPPSPEKGIALVGLRDDGMDEAPGQVAEFVRKGYHVVVFGRAELTDKLRGALPEGVSPHAWFETHAAPHGGLFQDADGRCIVPTDSSALSTVSWVWVGEFVSACTRLGKMPPMYLSYMVEGAFDREAKLKGLRFHDKLPSRVEAGVLGRQFLSELRRSLAAVHDSEMPGIRRAAAQALQAKAAGGRLWVYLQGHVLLRLMGCPHDPRWFEPVHRGWNEMRRDVKLARGDFVLCIGYDQIYAGPKWEDFAEQARKVGATLVWSFTDYRDDQAKAVGPGEVFINQHWARGDAVAEVPGYDVKCLPTSGVIAEAVLWMVHAEMFASSPAGADGEVKRRR